MKAEENTFAFYVLFSCYAVCIFIEKKTTKTVFRDGGREVERDNSRGTGGQNACGG